jgi:hypothetical protein
VTECRLCGEQFKAQNEAALPHSGLCDDCKVLRESAERLINKNPKIAVHYFTDLFMQARRRTISKQKLENCIWEAWWGSQRDNFPTSI